MKSLGQSARLATFAVARETLEGRSHSYGCYRQLLITPQQWKYLARSEPVESSIVVATQESQAAVSQIASVHQLLQNTLIANDHSRVSGCCRCPGIVDPDSLVQNTIESSKSPRPTSVTISLAIGAYQVDFRSRGSIRYY